VGTLRRAVPDLAYYSLTAGVVLLMMTAWGHLLMGSIYQPFSTFSGTFHWVMLFFIAGDLSGAGPLSLTKAVKGTTLIIHPVQLLLIRLWTIALAVFVFLILVSFLFAILGVAFFVEKWLQGGGAPSMASQLHTVIRAILPHHGRPNPHKRCQSVLRRATYGTGVMGKHMQESIAARLGMATTFALITRPRPRVVLAGMRMAEEDLAEVLTLCAPKGQKTSVSDSIAAVAMERFGELPASSRAKGMMDVLKEIEDTSRQLTAVEVAQLLTCAEVKRGVETLAAEIERQLFDTLLAQHQLEELTARTESLMKRRRGQLGAAGLKRAANKVRASGALKQAVGQHGALKLANIVSAAKGMHDADAVPLPVHPEPLPAPVAVGAGTKMSGIARRLTAGSTTTNAPVVPEQSSSSTAATTTTATTSSSSTTTNTY